MSIKYRSVSFSNDAEIKFIAEQDSKIPLQYDSTYVWNEKSVERRIEFYKKITPEDFFEVATEEEKIIGFQLVHSVPYPPDLKAGLIATLWVAPSHQGQGISSALKARGEKWAMDRNFSFLLTSVHTNNSIMLAKNAKSGFETMQLLQRKKLQSV